MRKIFSKLIYASLVMLLGTFTVDADVYSTNTENDKVVPENSMIIGTHMYLVEAQGMLSSNEIMFASSSLIVEKSDDVIVYYYLGKDEDNGNSKWLNVLAGTELVYEGEFCITHINGEKLEDTSCADTTVPSVTVQFITNSEGQTDNFEVSVKEGELLPLPKTPTRIGYVFDKWTLVVEGESTDEEFDFENTLITEDITLEANWKPITYTIKYHNYDGELKNTFDYSNDEDLTASLVNPEKDGYKFIGWSLVDNTDKTYNRNVKLVDLVTDAVSANLVEVVTEEEVTSYVINVYTNWETNTYEITYVNDGNYDEDGNVTTYSYEDESVTLVNPSKEYYEFLGWTIDGSEMVPTKDYSFVPSELAMTDITFVANWKALEYKVVLNGNSGLTQESLETYTMENACSYDSKCILDENPFVKDGYTFAGWSDTIDGQVIINDKEDINGMGLILNNDENGYFVNLYAVWNINEYNITYDLVDGSFDGEVRYSYNVNTTDELVNATKNGYKFIGWSLKDTTDIVTINDLVQKLEDVELVANWEAIQYNIVFNGNGGLNSDSLDTYENINKCEYNKECLLDENLFVRNGYEFVGWSTDIYGSVQYEENADVNGSDISSLLVNENDEYTLNLYAVWDVINYDIMYDLAGGIFNGNVIYSYNVESTDELATPVRVGYTFEGWKLGDNFVTISDLISKLANASLVASWTPNVYTISYHGINTDGSLVVDQVNYDEDYVLKTLDSSNGQFFLGWSLEENGPVYYGAGITVENLSSENDFDLNLYPVYMNTEFSITYALLGGSFVDEFEPIYSYTVENVLNNNLIDELPSDDYLVKDGFAFAGWLDANGNEVTQIDYTLLEDLVYIAKWEAVESVELYSIDYDFDGDGVADANLYDSYSNLNFEYINGQDNFLFVPSELGSNNSGTFVGYYIYDNESSSYKVANFDTCGENICISSTNELTGNILLLPVFSYSITYDVDGDGVVDEDQYPELITSYNTLDIGKNLVNPSNVLDGALEFDSWVLTSNNEAVVTTLNEGLGNLELTGTWIYNVIYDVNVDEISLPNTYSTKDNELVLNTYVPDVEGSTFVKYQYSFDELVYEDVPSCDDKYCLNIADASGDVYIKVVRNYDISYIDTDDEVIETNNLPKTHSNDIERITLPILTSEDENTVFKGYNYIISGTETEAGSLGEYNAVVCEDVVNKYCVNLLENSGPITIIAIWEYTIPYSGITEDEITSYGLPKTYLSIDEEVRLPEITSSKEGVKFIKYQHLSTNIGDYSDISMCEDDEKLNCIDVSNSQILDVMVIWGYDINYSNLSEEEVVSYGLPTSHSTLDSVVKLPKLISSVENVKFNSYKYHFVSLDGTDTTEAVEANECDENENEYCISLPGDYLLNIEVVWEYEISYSEEVVDLPTSYLSSDEIVRIPALVGDVEGEEFVKYLYSVTSDEPMAGVSAPSDIEKCIGEDNVYCLDVSSIRGSIYVRPVWKYDIDYTGIDSDFIALHELPLSYTTDSNEVRLIKLNSLIEGISDNKYMYSFLSAELGGGSTESVEAVICADNANEFCIDVSNKSGKIYVDVIFVYSITYGSDLSDLDTLPKTYLSTDVEIIIPDVTIENEVFKGYYYKLNDTYATLTKCDDGVNYCYRPNISGYKNLEIVGIFERDINYKVNDLNDSLTEIEESEFLSSVSTSNKFNSYATTPLVITWNPNLYDVKNVYVNNQEVEIETMEVAEGVSLMRVSIDFSNISDDVIITFEF